MKYSSLFVAVSLLALTTAPAFAQEIAAEEAAPEGDIIVTANRTESLASKTPVSLTAISGEGLREAGITNPTALAEQVPSLSIDRVNGGIQLTIRGVTSTDTTEKGDPSAAFLLDGVYIARPQTQEVSFFDVSRVEVLRGPQGTLYGRNTTAGLVNVITNRPSTDALSGSVDVGYGNFGAWQATGVINAPLGENAAIRAAVNYDRRDNYLVAGPLFTGKHNPFKENLSGRVSALFKWDSGDVIIRGDYSDIGGNPFDLLPLQRFFAPGVADVDPVYVGGSLSSRDARYLNAPIAWDLSRNNKSWGIGGELNQELGGLVLSYVGSYRKSTRDESDARISRDGVNAFRVLWDASYRQQSHELRLATNGDGPLTAQVGAYYFKEDSDIVLKLNLGANPGATGEVGTTLGFFQSPTKAKTYAFFGQATYSLTDAFRATAGVRYSHDDKSRVGFNANCTNMFFNCAPAAGALPNNNAQVTFAKTTWRLGFDYDVAPGSLLYATVSTGYKSGGFNDGCAIGSTGAGCAVAPSVFFYSPETLTSYEAGVKARFLDNAVRLNASVFHYDYSNLQLTQALTPCPATPTVLTSSCSVTTNAAKAKVDGAELEGVITPSDNDRFDFTVAYLNARYDDFPVNATRNLAGRALDRSPKWAFTAGYQHTFPIGEGEIVAGIRTRVSDDYNLLAIGTRNFYRQPGFTKTDATITYNAADKRFYVQGFVKNIENAIVVTTVAGPPSVRSTAQISDPRTFGVRAGFKF
jgi:iron complex outermembrane recepter protein